MQETHRSLFPSRSKENPQTLSALPRQGFRCMEVQTLGFILLTLSVLLTSVFGLIIKSAHHTGRNPIAVGGLNYIAAAILGGLYLFFDSQWRMDEITVLIGVGTGLFYVVSFWFLARAVARNGVAVTMALVRLSVLAPILCSIFIWDEIPTFAQTVGIVFVCLAFPFLSLGGPQGHGALSGGWWLIAALFVATGFCNLSPKVFSELAAPEQIPLYAFALFGTSAVASLVYFRTAGIRVDRNEYGHGIVQGTCNILSAATMIWALKYLPGTIVFPVTSAAGLVITTAAATLFWKEQLRTPAFVGIGLTLVALVLVNVK